MKPLSNAVNATFVPGKVLVALNVSTIGFMVCAKQAENIVSNTTDKVVKTAFSISLVWLKCKY